MQLIYLSKEILEIILFILGANEIFKKMNAMTRVVKVQREFYFARC